MGDLGCETLEIQRTSEMTARIFRCDSESLQLQQTFRLVQWKGEEQTLWLEEEHPLWYDQQQLWPDQTPAILNNITSECSIDAHDEWGPSIAEPCQKVVFTGFRIWSLRRESTKARRGWLFYTKLALYLLYAFVQKSLFDYWVNTDAPTTRLTIPTTTLIIISSFIFPILSGITHIRSLQPSTILTFYLAASLLFDLTRLRTLSDISGNNSITSIYTVALAIKLVLLVAELIEKRHLFLERWIDVGPEEASGAISKILYLWVNRVFARGWRSVLTVYNLPALDSEILNATNPTDLVDKWNRTNKMWKDALLWTFIKHYKWSLLAGVIPRLASSFFCFCEPFLVEKILRFTSFTPEEDRQNVSQALIVAYAVMQIGKALSWTLYEHRVYRSITVFRGSLITLIFGKTLSLGTTNASGADAITLMSADIGRIEDSMRHMHEFYASFIDTAVSLWLLFRLLGFSMLGPAAWVIVCLFLGAPIATAAGNAQVPWLESIEERLAVTTKMLGFMKPVKMTGMTEKMSAIIANPRQLEIRRSRLFRMLIVLEIGAAHLSAIFAPVIGFGLFTLLSLWNGSTPLTAPVAFATLGVFRLQEGPLSSIITSVEYFQTIRNSFRRIQEHLVQPERVDPRTTLAAKPSPYFIPAYYIDTDRLIETEIEPKYDETELEAAQQSLYNTKVAMTIQSASAGYSTQSNIVRNLSFQVGRSKTTMIIGPVGSGKSTLIRLLLGEMPHVTGIVATAFTNSAFCPQSPWITWGTIQQNIQGKSDWDPVWYQRVTQACSLSRDFEELPDGDQTNTGTRGSRLSGGQQMRISLARALYSKEPLMILDDVLTGLDRTTEASILNSVFGIDGLVKELSATVVLATNTAAHLHYADHIIVLGDDGMISEQGTLQEVSSSGGYAQRLADLPVPVTAREPELEISKEVLEDLELPSEDDGLADGSRSASDFQIYKYYIQLVGPGTFLFYIFGSSIFILSLSFPSIWVQWWTNSNKDHPNENVGYWLGGFVLLGTLALASCVAADWVFRMIMLPRTSRRVHELLLGTTLHANTAFLTSTDIGQTTNRFSQDLQLIDSDLPRALDLTVINALSVIVSSVLVFMGSGYTAAAIPACVILLLTIQYFYLRTSRQIRLLDIEAKAPLFSQFLETLSGVSCIRAYGWAEEYVIQGHQILDNSQRPYYIMGVIQRWLTLVLQLMVGGIGILLVTFATSLPDGSGALLGVALFKVIDFSTSLEDLITQWTLLETSLGAMSRVRTFIKETKPEDLPHEIGHVPFDWPHKGGVVFNSVSASYTTSAEPVLKRVQIDIEPGQKIAICGRTGSGKSSLISTLLRMLELEEGSIIIDGIDISKIPRQLVRRNLNTLPQETFFIQGTIRENIDPLGLASDKDIIDGLKAAKLWDIFEKDGGLDGELFEERLSHGQRQLFCLIRSIVRPGKIVIMDEATSNADADTEELIQGIISKSFSNRTLIVVAHKLDSVLDFDRVAVLNRGQLVEWGNPRELLAVASAFRSLYESMGKVNTSKEDCG